MSEIPAKSTASEPPSDGSRGDAPDAADTAGRDSGDGRDPKGTRAPAAPAGDPQHTDPDDRPYLTGGRACGAGGAADPGAAADVTWQSSPPGSLYDYLKVAAFSIGPDGLIDHWSRRAEQIFGIRADQALGRDPIEAFVPPELRERGQRKMTEILDGREWTGTVPFRLPAPADDAPTPAATRLDTPARTGAEQAGAEPTRREPASREPAEKGQGAAGLTREGRDGARQDGAARRTGDGPDRYAEIYVMPTENTDGRHSAVCLVIDVRTLRGIETDLAASQAIFGQSPFGFLLFDTELRVRRTNRRFATVFGGSADDHRGHTVHDYLPRGEADRLSAALRRVLTTGEPVNDMQLVGPLPGSAERRHWTINLYRVHGGTGAPIGVAGIGSDVTRRHAAAREAAHARRNLALLNEAGARIGNSLDLETTARELLDVTVPGFCDLASVDLYQGLLAGDESPSGRWAATGPQSGPGSAALRRVAFASAVSDAPFADGGDGGPPVPVGAVHHYAFATSCAEALRIGRPRLVTADRGLIQSTLAVPMVAHDTVVGLAQFSRAKGSEPFGDRDRALAVELAARAAVCIDNARLYRREHERALILQRSLLPPGDPEASGLDIACRYLPGTAATEVGGDWFDVIELPGHRTALVVGDVMGRGLRAAVAMGELRTAVRTLALLDLEPAEVLSALDEIASGLGTPASASRPSGPPGSRGADVRPHGAPAQPDPAAGGPRDADLAEVYLATCIYAVYDPVTRRCTFANAGHLPPVVVEPGEPALMLDVPPGMPLGVGGEPFEEVEVELAENALLALYTDGLVESRDNPLDEGLKAFIGTLTEPSRPLEDVCDHVLNTLDTAHGEDDVALLMARIQGLPAGSVGDWTLPREALSVGRAREYARAQLLSWDLEPLADTTELLVSEVVTNALRYGDGEIRLRLLLDRTLVCEVWDANLVQPRRRRARDTDEGGRGLQLVTLLSSAWGSRRTPRGKTVWFEMPLPDGDAQLKDPSEALLSLF